MKIIYFVILHYLDYEDTIECVESIERLESSLGYTTKIVIVDNGSNNGSWERIQEKLDGRIIAISNPINIGFAKGNNIGYSVAKDDGADYIVVLNSDTVLSDVCFLDKIVQNFEEYNYDVLGPNLLTVNGNMQQNPLNIVFDEKRVKKLILNSAIMYLCELCMINEIRRRFHRSVFSEFVHKTHDKILANVPLHGACLIYSPKYVERVNFAFYPSTFLYLEENIIFYICQENGLKTLFDPSMTIYHKEDASTSILNKNNSRKKMMFTYKHQLNSAKEFLKLIKSNYSIDDMNRFEV